jgi:hypothetical protein
MRATALRHTGVVEEFTMLQATVSTTAELVLGRSLDETSRVEIMNELIAKFQKLEELCSRLEGHGKRICRLLLGPPPSHACWADCLEEAAGRLKAAMAEQRRANAELEAL